MPRSRRNPLVWASLVLGMACSFVATPTTANEPTPVFERDVRPILKAYCLDCHGGGEKLEGNLDLRLKRFAERGGDSGPAIIGGKPAESLLIARLNAGEMPPGEKKLSAEQIGMISRWIAGGAPTSRQEPESLPPGIDITPEDRAFWAFQPLHRPEPPIFGEADRVRTPIDAFVLSSLREANLSFAPDADKLTLIRRAALDLTGLPPTPEQIQTFLADDQPRAYERMLDGLLESPHYGERWGRHWLDVAGYADSDGNGTEDTPRPYAYKYRDYVIRSLNADKPFNQFLIEQLAGDELAPPPWNNLTPEQIEKLTATGFLRTAADATAGAAAELEPANQVVTDTLKIVSSSLLGLSVGCAQCHDHRYDPIPQSDYFRLRAIFEPAFDTSRWRRPPQRLVSLYTDADRAKAAAIDAEANTLQEALNVKTQKFLAVAFEKELLKFPEEQRTKLRDAYNTSADKRTEEQKQLLASNPSINISAGVLYQYDMAASDELKKDAEQIAAKRAEKPVEDFLSILSEVPGQVPPTHLHYRGDYRQPKQAVTPGDLTIAAPDGQRLEIPEKDSQLATTGRRLAYAKHLTTGRHPLLGRVLANRIWLHHFGRGLVETPGDFGFLGTKPTHPALLDWLATEFPRQGWSLKAMHRLVMTSTVYRQVSQLPLDQAVPTADVENHLYSRFPIQRLDAEAIRDRMLATSGKLDRTPFGPPIAVAEDFVGQVLPAGDSPRRSIYLQVRRSKPVSFLAAFDAPVMTVNCDRRFTSTTAPQSLVLMNSDFVLAQADALAKRMQNETPAEYAKDTVAGLASAFQRPAEAWQFGYGEYAEAAQRIVSFAPLSHFTGSNWQGGAQLPDPAVGWVILHAAGGHAGNDQQHAAIRRWTAPRAGTVFIAGKLAHAAAGGDGVRGRIVSSRHGLAAESTVLNSEAAMQVPSLEVQAGDTLDFAVDCQSDVNCDSFSWNIEIKLTDAQRQSAGLWNSVTGFHGPVRHSLPQLIAFGWEAAYQRPITAPELAAACDFVVQQIAILQATGAAGDHELAALTSYCQQLLSSNEFLYVE